MQIFGDFATNFEADDRADSCGPSRQAAATVTRIKIGLGIGQLKKKRDWEVRALVATPRPVLRSIRILIDSDLFDQPAKLCRVSAVTGRVHAV